MAKKCWIENAKWQIPMLKIGLISLISQHLCDLDQKIKILLKYFLCYDAAVAALKIP